MDTRILGTRRRIQPNFLLRNEQLRRGHQHVRDEKKNKRQTCASRYISSRPYIRQRLATHHLLPKYKLKKLRPARAPFCPWKQETAAWFLLLPHCTRLKFSFIVNTALMAPMYTRSFLNKTFGYELTVSPSSYRRMLSFFFVPLSLSLSLFSKWITNSPKSICSCVLVVMAYTFQL